MSSRECFKWMMEVHFSKVTIIITGHITTLLNYVMFHEMMSSELRNHYIESTWKAAWIFTFLFHINGVP